ncbi:MAG: hypothetical protein V4659_03165 [Pseudomonadota bacterium]
MFGKIAAGGLTIGGAYVAMSTGQPVTPQTFAVPATEAIGLLDAETRTVNGTGMGSLKLKSAGYDGGTVRIVVKRAGDKHRVECLVNVAAVAAAQSTATTDCTQPPGADRPMQAVGVKALNMVVGEHVAATIERRTYDIDGVATGMMGLVVANSATIATSVRRDLDETAARP